MAAGAVLDAGALVALERGDRRARALIGDAEGDLIIPAAVLAQVWREGRRQARLAILLKASTTLVEPLDKRTAKAVGEVLGRSGTADVVDASVVISARRHKAIVLTADPDDLLRIDPGLEVAKL